MTTYRITIPSVTCESCTNAIRTQLNDTLKTRIDDKAWSMSVLSKKIRIDVDESVTWEEIVKIIDEAGHEIEVQTCTRDGRPLNAKKTTRWTQPKWIHWLRAAIAGLIGIPLFIICIIGFSIPLYGMILIAAISLGTMLFAGYEIFKRAFYDFKKSRAITMDTLFSISSIIAFIVSVVGIALPTSGIPMFFEAAILILGFRELGIGIQNQAKSALHANRKFLDLTPYDMQLGNKWVSEYEIDEIFTVKAGDLIPLDGEIIEGHAEVRQRYRSGDFHPKLVYPFDSVYAGMYLQSGELKIRVKSKYQDSLLAKLDQLNEAAEESKPPIQTLMTKVLKGFVPTVGGIALLSLALVGAFVSPMVALSTFLSVLCVACPCVFGWLVALAIQVAIGKASKNNILITKHHAMQVLKDADTFVMDVTGTLTKPMITAVVSKKPRALLSLALQLEQGSTHVIANAVRSYSNAQGIYANQLSIAEDHLGLGRRAMIDGQECLIGDERLLQKREIDYSAYQENLQNLHAQGKTALFIVKNREIQGYLVQEYQLKADAKSVMDQLRQKGVKHFKICTGTHAAQALAIATQLGIPESDVRAEQTPEDKMRFVQECQAPRHTEALRKLYAQPESPERSAAIKKLLEQRENIVAYLGDGNNDSIAMTTSDVGIAMSSGDDICRSHAGILIPDDQLQDLANVHSLSHQVMNNIKLNLVLTIAFNAVMIAIAAGVFIPLGFTLTPAISAVFMIVEALIVLTSVFIFKQLSMPGKHLPPQKQLPGPQLMPLNQEDSDDDEDQALLNRQPSINPSPLGGPKLSFEKRRSDDPNRQTDQFATHAEFDQSVSL